MKRTGGNSSASDRVSKPAPPAAYASRWAEALQMKGKVMHTKYSFGGLA